MTKIQERRFETLLLEQKGRVTIITLNRPKALNALNSLVLRELTESLNALDQDQDVGCIVITGSEKAFAAGADIKEMQSKSLTEMHAEDFLSGWEAIGRVRKPIIAAVSGFALGGGCELALMCDMIFAADTAKFGQPEVKLGVMPGMGGSQRLTRIIGRSKAMDLCLTGRMMSAEEAERSGLVARIFPAAELLAKTIEAAEVIGSMSLPSVLMIKEAINQTDSMSLADGLRFERRVFHTLFATEDQKEGMAAFAEKRTPNFRHR